MFAINGLPTLLLLYETSGSLAGNGFLSAIYDGKWYLKLNLWKFFHFHFTYIESSDLFLDKWV